MSTARRVFFPVKRSNFRSRSYPLIITVDGKEAFAGTTHTSLGYCTIACKPTKGKKVRIQINYQLKR
jgi:beta-galactosidase